MIATSCYFVVGGGGGDAFLFSWAWLIFLGEIFLYLVPSVGLGLWKDFV